MVVEETLDELKKRCRFAVQHNFGLAKAEEYVEMLGGSEPPKGIEKCSAAHVLHLLESGPNERVTLPAALAVKAEAAHITMPVRKAAPKKAEKVAEAKAEAKVEAKLEDKSKAEDDFSFVHDEKK